MTAHRRLTPLVRIVESDAKLCVWNDRMRHEQAVQAALRRRLPRPIAERLYVTDGRSETLEIATGAAAIASVVRQRSPELLAALTRDGWQFSRIRVRVQPPSMPMSSAKTEPRQWDNAARRPLVALETQLAAGPLKAALGRLLRRR